MAMSEAEWDQGMELAGYLERMQLNAPTWRQNLQETNLEEFGPQLKRVEGLLAGGRVRAAVFSEPWCGDCMENVPVVGRLAQEMPGLEVRVFSRESDLMQRYLTGGKAIIPTVVFFLPGGPELCRFIERPAAAHAFLASAAREAAGLEEPLGQEHLRRAKRQLRELYRQGLRSETAREILDALEGALARMEA
ncbi:MAG: thioredoxin family protein [Bacillota bacterium]